MLEQSSAVHLSILDEPAALWPLHSGQGTFDARTGRFHWHPTRAASILTLTPIGTLKTMREEDATRETLRRLRFQSSIRRAWWETRTHPAADATGTLPAETEGFAHWAEGG